MCGITAIYAYAPQTPGTGQAPVDRAELARINAHMAPRGPDGEGVWVSENGQVGLAHRRLAIIDLSETGTQPMSFSGGRLQITFNGEIYNYRALKAELEAEGRVFESNSDTEVILQLYDRDGPEMVRKLRGMFALALWDNAKGGLLLARDPFGIKPLYYADNGRTVRAASQVKALLAGGAIDTASNPAGHAGFYLFGYVPEPHTLYAGIAALPAGTTVWVDAKGAGRPESYFDLKSEISDVAGSEEDNAEAMRSALADSVAAHLVADVPVGVFLSAGLDSATVLALAAEAAAAPLQSLTLGFSEFEGSEKDEAPLAADLAAQYATKHVAKQVAGAEFHADFEKLLAAMDQPSIDGVNTYFVAKAAAEAGLKVALSGVGGDELFFGYNTFRDVPALANGVGRVPGVALAGKAFRTVAAPFVGHIASPKYAGLFEYTSSLGAAYLLHRGLFMPWELADVMGRDMAEEGLNRLQPVESLDRSCDAPLDAQAKIMALEMAWYLRGQLLRDADWAGMAHSVEIRTPLVDAWLFRAVKSLSRDKQAMAATPARALPDAILNRAKTGFFVPVHDWVQGQSPGDARERGLRGWARMVHAAFT